jgi:hypothetical protein
MSADTLAELMLDLRRRLGHYLRVDCDEYPVIRLTIMYSIDTSDDNGVTT